MSDYILHSKNVFWSEEREKNSTTYCLYFQLKRSSSKPKTEVGTQNDKNDVDYDWLPKETTDFSKFKVGDKYKISFAIYLRLAEWTNNGSCLLFLFVCHSNHSQIM